MKMYEAVVAGDRIEWIGDRPEAHLLGGVEFRVVVGVPVVEAHLQFHYAGAPAEAEPWTEEKGQRIRAILGKIAASGELDHIDPVAWQREIREDRPIVGRES